MSIFSILKPSVLPLPRHCRDIGSKIVATRLCRDHVPHQKWNQSAKIRDAIAQTLAMRPATRCARPSGIRKSEGLAGRWPKTLMPHRRTITPTRTEHVPAARMYRVNRPGLLRTARPCDRRFKTRLRGRTLSNTPPERTFQAADALSAQGRNSCQAARGRPAGRADSCTCLAFAARR